MSRNTRGAKAAPGSLRFFKLDLLGEADEDLCFIDSFVEGIEYESWRTAMGEQLAPVFPKNARIPMSTKYPGIQLTSLLATSRSTLFGSRELKDVIEKHCSPRSVECLPFTLQDHRKRPYSQDYFIINPIGAFDCLDFKASNISWSKEKPDEILDIKEHVLDRKKMKDAPQLFRVAKDSYTYVIGLELIREMKKRDFSNIVVEELEFSDSK